MKCRNCGIEIADKALICYRCGTATTAPTFNPPVAARRSRSPILVIVIVLVVLLALDLYIGRMPAGDPRRVIGLIAAIVAVVIVVLRAYARRR